MDNKEDFEAQIKLMELDIQVESLLKEFSIFNDTLKYRIMMMIIQSNLKIVTKNKTEINQILTELT